MGYTIPFSPCPIDHHKGEMWEKLQNRDLKSPVIIKDIEYLWSNEVPLQVIKDDTFQDFVTKDWEEVMFHFYNMQRVFGILIHMDHHDGELTTFRAYKPDTVRYYNERRHEKTEMYLKVRKVA